VYEADSSAIAKTEPLLLVVNRGTASASEVRSIIENHF
jgi:C-terminal processing protease CtpA/Prc